MGNDETTLEWPGNFDNRSVAMLFASQLLSLPAGGSIRLRFLSDSFVKPSGMALFTALGLVAKAKGIDLLIDGYSDRQRYMARMDVFIVLDMPCRDDFFRHPEFGRFVPVKLITCDRDRKAAVDSVCDLVISLFEDAHKFLPALEWCVNEVTDNIIMHSESLTAGVLCAQ